MELELFEAPRALALRIGRALEGGGVRAPALLMAAALQCLAMSHPYSVVRAMLGGR